MVKYFQVVDGCDKIFYIINILEYYIINQDILKNFFLSKALIIAASNVPKVPAL